MLKAGDVIAGRYRLIRPIGSGGMASVWAAHHELLERDVAIKITPVTGKNTEGAARFLREASIVGRFTHKNIVGVVDAGEVPESGCLFLVMELLRGASLADRFVPDQPLSPAEILPILIGVCSGLEAAHAVGIVHRDVKPENVFLASTTHGITPKLVDFGISQDVDSQRSAITLDGQILGTPAYMSPEQALGRRRVDARSDLWAVGVILYEALAGRQPFGSSTHHSVLRRIVDDEPEPLPECIDDNLRAIVRRSLEKDPDRRYQDATTLRKDLEDALERVRASGDCTTEALQRVTFTEAFGERATVPAEEVAVVRAAARTTRRTTFSFAPRRRVAALACAGTVALLCLGAAFPGARAAVKHLATAVPAQQQLAESSSSAAAAMRTVAPTTAPSASPPPNPGPTAPNQVAPARPLPAPLPPRPIASSHEPRPITRITSPGF